MNRFLIVGANSFTATHLSRCILSHGDAEVFGADIHPESINTDIYSRYLRIDTTGNWALSLLRETRPHYLINCAGLFRGSPAELLNVNLMITARLISAMAELKLELQKSLFIGSAAEYGVPISIPISESHELNPVNPYGLSKKFQSELLGSSGADFILVRPFNLVGQGLNANLVIPSIISRLKSSPDGKIRMGNLDSKRDFISVTDAVGAMYQLMINPETQGIYNIASSIGVSIKEILGMIEQVSGRSINVIQDPELISPNDVPEITGDISRIREEIGWSPQVELMQELKSMWEAAVY
jgi:nucleoside-diphosphate-sugar epimerase